MGILTAYDKFIQQALKYGFSLWGTAKTGQTTKYKVGDDGDLEKGYPKVPPRFTDNGDGTITDNATGLMWVKDPSQCAPGFGTPGNPAAQDWHDAIENCFTLTYAGHNDWRLPNIKELFSIIDFSKGSPAIDTNFFVCESKHYWASTTYNAFTTWAWDVNFIAGIAGITDKDTNTYYPRPVRLGIPK